jgi:hypothetical protein
MKLHIRWFEKKITICDRCHMPQVEVPERTRVTANDQIDQLYVRDVVAAKNLPEVQLPHNINPDV